MTGEPPWPPASRAPIALTIGEPAGIGPEIGRRGLAKAGRRAGPFFVAGRPGPPARARRAHPDHIRTLPEAAHASLSGCRFLVHDFPAPAVPGRPDPRNAEAVIAAIAHGVDLVMRGQAGALTTGPIHKKALIDGAGFAYPGHTEYLAHLAGVDRVAMMLAGPDLRVVP